MTAQVVISLLLGVLSPLRQNHSELQGTSTV